MLRKHQRGRGTAGLSYEDLVGRLILELQQRGKEQCPFIVKQTRFARVALASEAGLELQSSVSS